MATQTRTKERGAAKTPKTLAEGCDAIAKYLEALGFSEPVDIAPLSDQEVGDLEARAADLRRVYETKAEEAERAEAAAQARVDKATAAYEREERRLKQTAPDEWRSVRQARDARRRAVTRSMEARRSYVNAVRGRLGLEPVDVAGAFMSDERLEELERRAERAGGGAELVVLRRADREAHDAYEHADRQSTKVFKSVVANGHAALGATHKALRSAVAASFSVPRSTDALIAWSRASRSGGSCR